MLPQVMFYVLSGVAILAASMVVLARHPVRAVLFLILAFFASAGLWLLLEIEFLAVVLVLVYVGAVMVLFLFVVMMLDVEMASIREGFTRYLPLGICVAGLLLLLLIYGLGPHGFGPDRVPIPESYPSDYSNVKELGELLFSKYLFHLQVAGMLLLVAMVASIRLAFRGPRKRKGQDPALQSQVRPENRIRLIKTLSPKSDSPDEEIV